MQRPRIPGYEVGGPIGFGVSGAALAVRDRRGTSRAAVLVPHDDRAARLAELVGIDHPHLPPIRDVIDLGAEGSAVIMDLVVGPSLATLVNARSWLSPAEVATVWHGIADALAALHRRGLVHGDVSPANIIVGPQGSPVLVDIVGHGGSERGHTGYIPPELDSGPATAASDVWSLARTLTWASGEDAGVTRAVGVALAADPADRPGARDFATWSFLLGRASALDLPPAADLAGAQVRAASAPTLLAQSEGGRPSPGPWWRTAVAVAVGLVVLLLAGRALATAAHTGSPVRAVGPREPFVEVGAVVAELLDARDAALAAADAERLAAVHLPGSPVAAADQALLAALTGEGVRLEDYGTDVLAVEELEADLRSFTSRVEVRQRPHTRVGADGVRRPVAAQDPHCLLVSGVDRNGWLISDVEPCPADGGPEDTGTDD